MGDLSRRPSRQPMLTRDVDTNSLTSFPDPETASLVTSSSPPLLARSSSNTGAENPLQPIITNTSPPLPAQDPLADQDNTRQSPNGTPKPNALSSLLNNTGAPSLFDEQQSNSDALSADPQTLSTASNAVLQTVLDHHGTLALTRRLAALLAERDAHITALTRLAEEYKVPRERIADASVRAKQSEERRVALAQAVADVAEVPKGRDDAGGSGSGGLSETSSIRTMPLLQGANGTIKGLTRMFGGGGRGKKPGRGDVASNSSDTSSVPPETVRPRHKSDAASVKSVQSTQSAEGTGWTSMFVSNTVKRRDSRTSTPREPVEMITRRDKEQLPPTLSDRIEDPQEAAWNQFLLRLKQSQEQSDHDTLTSGIIGAAHFGQEGTLGQQKMKRLAALVLGGIPMPLRHPIWMELSHTDQLAEPDAYAAYLSLGEAQSDPSDVDAILKDVPRTLTSKYDFYAKKGFTRLKQVLVAFIARYDDLGYSQGLNSIAGYLLLVSPSQEDAFWLLCNIVQNFFPPDYFARKANLSGPLADNIVLRKYIEDLLPAVAKHLDALGIPPDRTLPLSWFYTAFSSVLSQHVLMRVWDVWLCLPNQRGFIFNVALALVLHNAGRILECADEAEYMGFVGNEIKLDGDGEWISELLRQALGLRKRLEGVEERREMETRVLRRRQGSTEALLGEE